MRSENAGEEEAQFFANFIIDSDRLDLTNDLTVAASLTTLDVDERSPHFSPKRLACLQVTPSA